MSGNVEGVTCQGAKRLVPGQMYISGMYQVRGGPAAGGRRCHAALRQLGTWFALDTIAGHVVQDLQCGVPVHRAAKNNKIVFLLGVGA